MSCTALLALMFGTMANTIQCSAIAMRCNGTVSQVVHHAVALHIVYGTVILCYCWLQWLPCFFCSASEKLQKSFVAACHCPKDAVAALVGCGSGSWSKSWWQWTWTFHVAAGGVQWHCHVLWLWCRLGSINLCSTWPISSHTPKTGAFISPRVNF